MKHAKNGISDIEVTIVTKEKKGLWIIPYAHTLIEDFSINDNRIGASFNLQGEETRKPLSSIMPILLLMGMLM